MSSFEIGVLIFMVWVCLQASINRICKCFETIAVAKSMDNMNRRSVNEQSSDETITKGKTEVGDSNI